MAVMVVDLNKPPGHARWCSGGCPRWLATGHPTCKPQPCQCEATKNANPEWGRRERCWWRSKRDNRIHCRCPCWGGPREGRPGDCCAHHSANPAYLTATATIEAAADADAEVAMHDAEPGDPGEREHDPEDLDELFSDWDDNPYAVVRVPYVARWTREELHCDCPVPGGKASSVVHCTADGCHQNFANPSLFEQHRRDWRYPCRPPHTLRDVDTGEPLTYQDADGIWRARYPSAA